MNELGIRGLMTAQEYANKKSISLERLGIASEYAEVHYFFIGREDGSAGDSATERKPYETDAVNFVEDVKKFSFKTGKVVFVTEGSDTCSPCKAEFMDFHGNLYSKTDATDQTHRKLLRANEKPLNYYLLDPVYSQFFTEETKKKIKDEGFETLKEYQDYIKDNFLFIFFHSNTNSHLHWLSERRDDDHSKKNISKSDYESKKIFAAPLGQYYEVYDGRFLELQSTDYKNNRDFNGSLYHPLQYLFKKINSIEKDVFKQFDYLSTLASTSTTDISSFT